VQGNAEVQVTDGVGVPAEVEDTSGARCGHMVTLLEVMPSVSPPRTCGGQGRYLKVVLIGSVSSTHVWRAGEGGLRKIPCTSTQQLRTVEGPMVDARRRWWSRVTYRLGYAVGVLWRSC
jgi:hypothetical protein